MSTPKNRIARSIAPKSLFEELKSGAGLSSSVSFNQGDLLCWDVTNKVVKIASSETTDGPNFLGIARCTVSNGVLVGPYSGLATTGQEAIGPVPGPQYGIEADLILKSGDVCVEGNLAYLDTTDGAQFVSASGTKAIGHIVSGGATGNGVSTVRVLLSARWPNDTQKY